MTKRAISFEIDDDIADHLDWLAKDWKKDPVWLARAFFEEELKAHIAGSRGVPLLRRYSYRDGAMYFTPEELEERAAERERQRDPVAEAKERERVDALFAKATKNRESRA